MNRRVFLGGAAATAIVATFWHMGTGEAEAAYPVTLTNAEWRKRLSPQAYAVLRQKSTEHPFTSPLNKEKREGVYSCAGCEQRLFLSKTKFDSGTGWPSFYRPINSAIGTSTDRELGYSRTEVHCARCGGHLGHVFDDGPRPTGLRYCMNGVAMRFVAGKTR
ncbi:peptide-methionine (R)-S-oxide reductase MsrB [Sphingobium aromaticiconvertens]|uniref:peptide-methionine (R)-S-oxide reductase MsrB n=1 Tax=Sphingobium aromaticiconvertens TaxID=365341 RepID=UPI00301AE97B